MSSSAYRVWVSAGRPWKVARPIADMVAYAKRHGIAVLGTIGNEAHLTASWPEDHAPFSFTASPVRLPLSSGVDRYWVCACDLANVKGLGDAILRDARAGRLSWLKYMNMGGRHYSHGDGFQSATRSADEHIHLSCFSDKPHTSIGGYDPLGAPGVIDMAGITVDDIARAVWGRKIGSPSLDIHDRPAKDWLKDCQRTVRVGREILAGQTAILAAVSGLDVVEAVQDVLDTAAERERAERAEERAQLLADVIAALPDGMTTTEQVRAALLALLDPAPGPESGQ